MSQSKRAPFEPISNLNQVPIALLEARTLVREGDSRADALLLSIINVTLTNPNAWAVVAGLQPEDALINPNAWAEVAGLQPEEPR